MDDALAGQLTQSRGVEGHDVRERVGVVDEALEVVALRSRVNGTRDSQFSKFVRGVPVHQHRIIAPQLAALIPSRAGLSPTRRPVRLADRHCARRWNPLNNARPITRPPSGCGSRPIGAYSGTSGDALRGHVSRHHTVA